MVQHNHVNIVKITLQYYDCILYQQYCDDNKLVIIEPAISLG